MFYVFSSPSLFFVDDCVCNVFLFQLCASLRRDVRRCIHVRIGGWCSLVCVCVCSRDYYFFTLDLLRFGSVNVCGSAQHGINASYRVVGVKMKPTWRICFSDVSPDSKMHC